MKMRIMFTLLIICLPGITFSQNEKTKNWELKGYIKDVQSAALTDSIESLTTSNLIHNRIRFKWIWSKHMFIRIECRNRIFYGEQVKNISGFGKYIDTDPGYIKLSKLWIDEKTAVVHSAIDRVFINYSTEKINIVVGRQRINWGINTVWNPNDLFNAYSFLDFDYEERPGADAIRMQFTLNTLTSFEIAYKPSEERQQDIVAALYKFNRWRYDFQILGGIYYNDFAVGGGWAGNIMEAGFKGEATYFRNINNFNRDDGALSASATIDYSLKKNWYVSGAMIYQSDPAAVIQGNPLFFSSNLSAKNLMPYRYTFYLGTAKGFSPVVSGSIAIVYSPTDNSLILLPALSYNVAQNFDLDLTLQSFLVEATSTGYLAYLRMKWSF